MNDDADEFGTAQRPVATLYRPQKLSRGRARVVHVHV
jgi:hypothetical protein